MAVQKRGHIKIARKAFAEDKWWLEKRVFSKWEAWEDMIQLAQHEAREFVTTKFGTIRLERGEFVLSLRRMAHRWGWGVQSTRSFTRSATFRTRLATQRETQAGTVYRIVNYDLYQSTEEKPTQPATQQITHDQHTSNTPLTQEQALKQLTTTTTASHEAANGTKPPRPEKRLPAVPKRKRGDLLVATEAEAEVFRYYHEKHPRRGPYDNDQLRKVRKGLVAFSVEQLKQAIDGNLLDEWAVTNHKHAIGWIFKGNDSISENIDRATSGEIPLVGDNGELTPAGQRFFARAH